MPNIVIIKNVAAEILRTQNNTKPNMINKIALGLLGFALLTGCGTTQTAQNTPGGGRVEKKARERNERLVASNYQAPPAIGPDWTSNVGEDIPAAGPDEEADVPAEGPRDIDRNPALVPSPLLRVWASSSTP